MLLSVAAYRPSVIFEKLALAVGHQALLHAEERHARRRAERVDAAGLGVQHVDNLALGFDLLVAIEDGSTSRTSRSPSLSM